MSLAVVGTPSFPEDFTVERCGNSFVSGMFYCETMWELLRFRKILLWNDVGTPSFSRRFY
ncbi:hypothetical protein DLM76_12650 [Leptospira yasudae]|nr:hypothetical protein DLM76_12650 [Leptospira yasudae]